MVRSTLKALFSLQILLAYVAVGVAAEAVDTVKLRAAIIRTDDLISDGSYDLAFKVADSLRVVTANASLANSRAVVLNKMGVILRWKGELSRSLTLLNQSLTLSDSLHNKNLVANNYNNIGAVNRMLGNYPLALKSYLRALKIKEELKDTDGMAAVLNNIGIVYLYQEDYPSALDYYSQSQVISQRINDLPGQAISYINIGEVYQKMGNFADAITCYMKGLRLSEKIGDSDSQAVISNELGNIYKSKGDCKSANAFYLRALVVFEQLGDKYRIAQVLTNLGDCCIRLNRKEDAFRYLSRALAFSKSIGSWELIKDVSLSLSKYFEASGNYKEALFYHQGYTAARDSSFSREKTEQLVRSQMRFDFEKEQEKIKAEQEKRSIIAAEKNRWQRTVRIMLFLVVGVLLTLLVVLLRNYRNKQILFRKLEEHQTEILDKNEELLQQQEEILSQRDEIERKNLVLEEHQREIEEQNERIMSSIEYAKTIQEAILPEERFFTAGFKDFFILYEPKDTVSGDFYWTYQVDDIMFVALADCTGHGVPGGFMSMIGNTLLNQIVIEWQVKDPALILEKLNILVRKALKQEGNNQSFSGMDIALIAFETTRNQFTFAGAKRPLYMFLGDEFVKLAGDSRSIGGYQLEEKRCFTNNTVEVNKPLALYLFSDGFSDQLNGNDKKFSVAQLKNLLSEMYHLPMEKQKHLLIAAHKEHRGSREQIDDITVIGLVL